MGSVAPFLIVFTLDTPRGGTSTSSLYTHSPSVSCQLWEPSTRPVSPAPGPHIQRPGVKPGSAADWSPILIFSLCPRSPGLIAAWSRDWWDVLNCSASTTIFTVNGSHRNTSYSDAGLKGIFSTHATINKHVDVATSCCCRLLKCNYNFCAQPPLGEVQCMCTTMQCIGKFLQLTEGWDIQLWYKPATIWRKSLTSLLFCYHLDTVSKIKTITIHNKTRLFEDKKRN